MRYCINYFNELENKVLLDKVDEVVFFHFSKNESIKDFIEKYPNVDVVISLSFVRDYDYGDFFMEKLEYFKDYVDRITFALDPREAFEPEVEEMKNYGYKFYFHTPVRSFEEATAAKAAGACALLISGELFFKLDKVKQYGLPIRFDITDIKALTDFHISSATYDEPSMCWIRPEDVDLYAEYIDTFELMYSDMSQTEAFIRIYKEQKEWPGEMYLLFLGKMKKYTNTVNRMLNSELTKKRINCGRVCQTPDGKCRLCHRQFELAVPSLFVDK